MSYHRENRLFLRKSEKKLPWLLRSHPHVLTTEAMALLMGRQASEYEFLKQFCNINDSNLANELRKGSIRRQLVFASSTFVITDFEYELYKNPDQDLNKLWWYLYNKYYKMEIPENRENDFDWAAKYHIGLAPVYYYGYLYGEVFASDLTNRLKKLCNANYIWKEESAKFLNEKLFGPGAEYKWDKLIKHATGEDFSLEAWINECNSY